MMIVKSTRKKILFAFVSTKATWAWLVVLLFSILLLWACRNAVNERQAATTKAQEDTFTCPMHPQIIRNEPGTCPVCGMKLVLKEAASREQSQLDLTSVLRPANNYVLSQIAVTSIKTGRRPITIDALGSVDYDTRNVGSISARVSGRIEKLYVKYRYQHIHHGQPVMDIYSPELVTAQEELLFLLKHDQQNESLIKAAKEKLNILGLNSDQLQQIVQTGKAMRSVTVFSYQSGHIHEATGMNAGKPSPGMESAAVTEDLPIKEGMYVEKGQTVFMVYNTDNSWVLLNLFSDQAGLIKAGTPVSFVTERNPDKVIEARIGFIEPFFRAGSKTTTARIPFDNSRLQIPIGTQVRASIKLNSRESSWLPRESVLSLGLNNIVLLKEDAGFRVHHVSVGQKVGDAIEILGGLTTQDSVASNAQFLIDSESFIKTN
jgi:membrane fusion protein, copper/silver efflux system